jgi:cell volume regulation protein A
VLRYQVAPGSPADGRTVGDLHMGAEVWIRLIVRDGLSIRVRADTELEAGDEVLVLADPSSDTTARSLFTGPADPN